MQGIRNESFGEIVDLGPQAFEDARRGLGRHDLIGPQQAANFRQGVVEENILREGSTLGTAGSASAVAHSRVGSGVPA